MNVLIYINFIYKYRLHDNKTNKLIHFIIRQYYYFSFKHQIFYIKNIIYIIIIILKIFMLVNLTKNQHRHRFIKFFNFHFFYIFYIN